MSSEMKEWKKPAITEVSNNGLEGEILPPKFLERGGIRGIDEEITYHEIHSKQPGTNYISAKIYQIDPLLASKEKGYRFVMQLPRVNEEGCLEKYGLHYDKTVRYTDFVHALATRNGIKEFEQIAGGHYVFRRREDAELLKTKLIERQEKADLEFEVIEGDKNEK